MKPIKFKGCNTVYARNQPEYLPLVAHKTTDGEVTSCWKLSFFERLQIIITGRIYIQVLTFNEKLQPVRVVVAKPKEVTTDA